jgi:DNA-binding NarL/FixJ family response regulator
MRSEHEPRASDTAGDLEVAGARNVGEMAPKALDEPGAALALRARNVLQSADGATNTAIAKDLKLTKQTVGNGRSRFLAVGSTDCWTSPGLELPATSRTLR